MNAELEQIRVSFEELEMSPDEIALDRGLEVTSVKAALMQCSSVYRKLSQEPGQKDLAFTDDEAHEMKEIMLNTARFSEDEHLRFKAAQSIWDDKKGRKDLHKNMGQTVNNNFLVFNEQMKKVRAKANELKSNFLGQSSNTSIPA